MCKGAKSKHVESLTSDRFENRRKLVFANICYFLLSLYISTYKHLFEKRRFLRSIIIIIIIVFRIVCKIMK